MTPQEAKDQKRANRSLARRAMVLRNMNPASFETITTTRKQDVIDSFLQSNFPTAEPRKKPRLTNLAA